MNAREYLALKKKSQKIVYRLKYMCLANTYYLCTDRVEEQEATNAKSAHIMHQMKSSCTFDFLVWRDIVLKQMDLKTRSGSEDIDIKKLLLTFFSKIMHRLTVRLKVEYLDRWREHLQELMRSKHEASMSLQISAISQVP